MRTQQLSRAFLLARLLPAYLFFGLAKHVVPLPRLARWAWRPPRTTGRGPGQLQETVASATTLGQLLWRFDRNCLQRSLVLYRELSRAGADPRLCLGFRRAGTALEGHAWVEVAGTIVADDRQHVAAFTPVATFAEAAEPIVEGSVTKVPGS